MANKTIVRGCSIFSLGVVKQALKMKVCGDLQQACRLGSYLYTFAGK